MFIIAILCNISFLLHAYSILINNNTSGTDWQVSIKKATALSENDYFPPANLIDGKTSTFYSSGDSTMNPWIQLELTDTQAIKQIKMTNRLNLIAKGLSMVEVRVGNNQVTKENVNAINNNDICGIYYGPGKDGEVVIVMCPTPLKGKYVTIQVTDPQIQKMGLAEVEIYGQIIGIIKTY